MLRGLQALITVIEIVGSFIWVRLLYSQKESSLLKKIMYVAGVILIIALTIFQRNGAMYSRYYLLICIGLSSLVYFLRFRCRKQYFFMMAIYYESIYCLDLITSILVGYFTDNPGFMLEQQYTLKFERILIYLFTRCVTAGLFFAICAVKDRLTFFLYEKWVYQIPFFEHLILSGCDIVLSPSSQKQSLAWPRVRVLFIAGILFIFALIAFYIHSMAESMSELVEMQKSLYAQGYKNITLRIREKERLFHDMKNHLLAIQGMVKAGQMEQIGKYVDRLYESYGSTQEYTGKHLVDYLISEKAAYAQNCGISVDMNCGSLLNGEKEDEDMDWATVLGNLWDNAIESCERCAEEKQIRFSMGQRGNIVSIHMENSCPVSAKRTGLRTLKNPDEMHGIGMRSIRYVIAKYNGCLDWECKGEIFVIDITMYMG